jgi:hypothetical protein
VTDAGEWPALPLAEWRDTRDTLQLWLQIIGKVRMGNTRLVNHWWNVPLYVTARGLTTSLMQHPGGEGFQIDVDLREHTLHITTVSGSAAASSARPARCICSGAASTWPQHGSPAGPPRPIPAVPRTAGRTSWSRPTRTR